MAVDWIVTIRDYMRRNRFDVTKSIPADEARRLATHYSSLLRKFRPYFKNKFGRIETFGSMVQKRDWARIGELASKGDFFAPSLEEEKKQDINRALRAISVLATTTPKAARVFGISIGGPESESRAFGALQKLALSLSAIDFNSREHIESFSKIFGAQVRITARAIGKGAVTVGKGVGGVALDIIGPLPIVIGVGIIGAIIFASSS